MGDPSLDRAQPSRPIRLTDAADSPALDSPARRKATPVDVAVKECTFPTNQDHRFAAESINDQAFCPEALGREMADMEAEGMKCNLATDHVVVDGDLKTILTLTCTGRAHEAKPGRSAGGRSRATLLK